MNVFTLLLSTIFGYSLSHFGSNPRSKLKNKLPKIELKFIQLSPNVKIKLGKRVIHVHHWMYYSVILVITLTYNVSIFESVFAKGYMTGAILHGLTYPDWRRIVLRENINNQRSSNIR